MFMEMLSEELIKKISKSKGEEEWMLEFRLNSYRKFLELENPNFGPKIELDFSKLNYYKKEGNLTSDWNNVRCDIRNKFKTLGVIDAEKEHLSGVSNQFESEVIYHHGRDEIQEKGVIFLSTDESCLLNYVFLLPLLDIQVNALTHLVLHVVHFLFFHNVLQ